MIVLREFTKMLTSRDPRFPRLSTTPPVLRHEKTSRMSLRFLFDQIPSNRGYKSQKNKIKLKGVFV